VTVRWKEGRKKEKKKEKRDGTTAYTSVCSTSFSLLRRATPGGGKKEGVEKRNRVRKPRFPFYSLANFKGGREGGKSSHKGGKRKGEVG